MRCPTERCDCKVKESAIREMVYVPRTSSALRISASRFKTIVVALVILRVVTLRKRRIGALDLHGQLIFEEIEQGYLAATRLTLLGFLVESLAARFSRFLRAVAKNINISQ